nr:LysR family transcriptional regulator [Acidocella aromatica]
MAVHDILAAEDFRHRGRARACHARTAKALNLSQSAASSAISGLGQQFGLKLFHRVGHDSMLMTEFSRMERGRLTIHASRTTARRTTGALSADSHKTYLVQLPEAVKAEKLADGLRLVRRCYRVFTLASDHASLDTMRGMTRVPSRKSRVRESSRLGSVRTKPNGLATRP